MNTVPIQIQDWVDRKFPKPRVDRDWLRGCYEWAIEQDGVNPNPPFNDKLFETIQDQLLKSDLSESMDLETGISQNIQQLSSTGPTPLLVEVLSLMDVGSSAFQLDQVRKAREERIRGGGFDDSLEGDEDADIEVEGEGPLPKYPRGMLQFVLTDGRTRFAAMEYKPLPDFSLVKTPLGYKLQLKNVKLINGVAFLEPDNIVTLGGSSDRNEHKDYHFRQILRERMGLEREPPPTSEGSEGEENNENDENGGSPGPNPPPPPAPRPFPAAPPMNVRSPLREISPPPSAMHPPDRDDDDDMETRRRRVPSTSSTLLPTVSRSRVSSTTSPRSRVSSTASPYFSNPGSATVPASNLSMALSPTLRATAPTLGSTSPVVSELDVDFALLDEIEGQYAATSQNASNRPSAGGAAGPSSQRFPSVMSSTASTLVSVTPQPSAFPNVLASAPKLHDRVLDLTPEFAESLNSGKTKSTSKGKGKGKKKTGPSQSWDDPSDDIYDETMDSDDDDPYLSFHLGSDDIRQIEAAEHQATSGPGSSTKAKAAPTTSTTARTRTRTTSMHRSSSVTLSSGPGSGPSPSQQQRPKPSQPLGNVLEVIDIEDSDDADSNGEDTVDKENMPVQKRFVRQRTESEVQRLSQAGAVGGSQRATRPLPRGSQRTGSQQARGVVVGDVVEISSDSD